MKICPCSPDVGDCPKCSSKKSRTKRIKKQFKIKSKSLKKNFKESNYSRESKPQ